MNREMLSGKGNENGEKTTIGVISNKATLHAPQIFLYISLPLFCTTTTWNFLVTRFMEGSRTCFYSLFFFSLSPIFTLVAASISQFLTAATIFSCSSNKKRLHSFLSLAVAVCRSFSRWASLTCYLFSLFLCLSLSLNSKFVDMKINLSLILYTTRIQRQFPLFAFVFIDSLVVKTRVAMRFPAKITSSCIWVAMHVDWVILHWYACGADGRLVGRMVTWLPNFLEWVDHYIFLGMGLRSRALWALLSSSSSSSSYKHHPHHH